MLVQSHYLMLTSRLAYANANVAKLCNVPAWQALRSKAGFKAKDVEYDCHRCLRRCASDCGCMTSVRTDVPARTLRRSVALKLRLKSRATGCEKYCVRLSGNDVQARSPCTIVKARGMFV